MSLQRTTRIIYGNINSESDAAELEKRVNAFLAGLQSCASPTLHVTSGSTLGQLQTPVVGVAVLVEYYAGEPVAYGEPPPPTPGTPGTAELDERARVSPHLEHG